jgi:hypothetical protein
MHRRFPVLPTLLWVTVAQAAHATATLEAFEARLRRLEAATGGQAQR